MKAQIRKTLLSKRNNLTHEEILKAEKKIITHLLSMDILNQAESVMVYMDFKNEVRTQELIEHLLTAGKSIILPLIDHNEIIPYRISSLGDLKQGTFGILEPDKNKCEPFDAQQIDFVILPGVGFDRAGNRLGFGKGYYDRFFLQLKADVKRAALAYDFQIVPRIPAAPHDIPMHYIITEKQIICLL